MPASATAYRITYRVEQGAPGSPTTEVLEVDPGRVSRRLLPAGGAATTGSGVYDRDGQGRWRQLAVVAPGEAGHDLALNAPLEWAESAGLAQRDGLDEVAGLRCTWWVTGQPLDVGTFRAATQDDRVRSCVSERGLLLADTWRGGGRQLLTRTATEVRALRAVDALDGQSPPALNPLLVTTVVEARQAPVADIVRPLAPPGAALLSAARVTEVAPGTTDIVRRAERAVYVDGGVVTVLDQLRLAEPEPLRGDREIALGALGSGRVSGTAGGLVVEVAVGDGLLRVRSGLPIGPLVAWLTGLEQH